jgi:serine/threonine protein phosphatase PrpC
MVVYEWFARIGQVLAPDANYNADEAAKKDNVSIWHILAPDPNFTVTGGDTISTKQTPHSRTADASMRSPAASTTPEYGGGTMGQSSDPNLAPFYTPSPYRKKSNRNGSIPLSLQTPRCTVPYSNPDVERRVVSAAKDRAAAMTSPVAVLKTAGAAFRISKNSTVINERLQESLRKMIMNDPSILHIRSNGPQYECPEGYTIFMVATYANQLKAMEVIWDCTVAIGGSAAAMNLLTETNLEGKTVQHIAAERGHTEALSFLQAKYLSQFGTNQQDEDVPVDLMGHTPLGAALLSPEIKAKQNKNALLEQLYSDHDKSLLGSPLPVEQRIVGSVTSKVVPAGHSICAIAGMSEIPGKRIRMEDCTICKATSDGTLLLTVCDGHGDEGLVSHFVAESLITSLDEYLPDLLGASPGNGSPNWETVCTDICLRTDDALRSTNLRGGSVGVLLAVTESNIIVCNIGDCRCILVQSSAVKEDQGQELVNATKSLSLNTSDGTGENWSGAYSVKALSTDHKPNLPNEKDRIEKSGLSVISETVNEELVIHKIHLSDGNRLATSRAFGDFEYKSNKSLEVEAQAVIAVPEVAVHNRCADDVVLIAGCDGIWDVMSNQDVAMFVTERLHFHCSEASTSTSDAAALLPRIGDELLIECLKRGSDDNMSVVIVAVSTVADRVVGIQQQEEVETIFPPKTLDYAMVVGMTATE